MENSIIDGSVLTKHVPLKLKISCMRTIVCAVFFLPFFRLQIISIMMVRSGGIWTIINSLFNILQATISVIAFSLFITKKSKNPKSERVLYGFLLFESVRMLVSIINGSIILSTSLSNWVNIGFILVSYHVIQIDKHLYINCIELITGALSIISAITTIIMPLGFFPNEVNYQMWGYGSAVYFLGSKNSTIFYYLIFLFIIIYKELEKKEKHSICAFFLFGLFIASTISTNSINSTFCLLLLLISYIMIKLSLTLVRFISPRVLAVAIVVVGIVVLGGLTPELKVFNKVGRDTSFTGRTTLWYLAELEIVKHPLVGNGIDAAVIIGEKPWYQVHGTYVDIAFKYGIPAVVIFIGISLDILLITTHICDTKKRFLISVVLTIFYFHNLTDAPSFFCMLIPLCIAEEEALRWSRVNNTLRCYNC